MFFGVKPCRMYIFICKYILQIKNVRTFLVLVHCCDVRFDIRFTTKLRILVMKSFTSFLLYGTYSSSVVPNLLVIRICLWARAMHCNAVVWGAYWKWPQAWSPLGSACREYG